jgi:dUTP pyrophosphatase
MQVKLKKISPLAVTPFYASAGAACFDLVAAIDHPVTINPHSSENLGTGLCFELPEGYVMLVYSRSGHGFKSHLRFVNCVGVIDSDYRGEVRVGLANDGITPYIVQPGERIAQAMVIPCPQVNLVEVKELSSTERGTGGFGSTGK